MSNVFAYTGTELENGYVPYLSINEIGDKLVVTLRSSDNNPSSVEIPRDQIESLISSLAGYGREVGVLKPNIECKVVFDGESVSGFLNSEDGRAALQKALSGFGQGGGQ